MTPDDRDLAEHLAPAPASPDLRFRLGVAARIAVRRHRRAVLRRALGVAGLLTATGLAAPLVRDAWVVSADIAPLLSAAGAAMLAALLAAAAILGPGVLLHHAQRLLRGRL